MMFLGLGLVWFGIFGGLEKGFWGGGWRSVGVVVSVVCFCWCASIRWDFLEPVKDLIPRIPKPATELGAMDKIWWTAMTLLCFLVCCQIPLYGVRPTSGDPFYWMRVIMASNKGTLMELGISPIITSGMIIQLLEGVRLVEVDQKSKRDRELSDAASKIFALVITLGEAAVYTLSGQFGPVSEIGAVTALLIIAQLVVAGIIVMLLDELLQKGYGVGAGISLFIATSTCEQIVWDAFSPTTINVGQGAEFHGAIIALFHLLMTRSDKLGALHRAFFRPMLPNLSSLIATALVFVVVVFLQGLKVNLTLTTKANIGRGAAGTYPIRLFYTSNIPIILQAALVSNLYFFSQILYSRYKDNIFVRLIGTWDEGTGGGGSRPIGGIAYYLSPPQGFEDLFSDPWHFLVYLTCLLSACATFASIWVYVSRQSPADVEAQLQAADPPRFIKGSTPKVLKTYIPTAAALGGMSIGALSVFSDLLGARGSGTSMLLATTIIYQYYEQLIKNSISTGELDISKFLRSSGVQA